MLPQANHDATKSFTINVYRDKHTQKLIGPSLETLKIIYLNHVLEIADGNISEAARMLKLPRATMYRYIDIYKLNRPTRSKTKE